MQLREQLYYHSVQLARLLAERDERATFSIDEALPAGVDRVAAENVVATERRLFGERANLFRDDDAGSSWSLHWSRPRPREDRD